MRHDFVVQLGWEWTCAHARRVRLHYTNHATNALRRDAQTRANTTDACRRGRDEGIRAVV